MEEILQQVFGGDYPPQQLALHQIAARSVVLYLAGLVIVRVGKSRLLSRLTPLDVILGFILGSILARGMTGDASLSGSALAAAVLVASHYVLTSITYRWPWFGTFLKGSVKEIVRDGEPLRDVLRQSHLSENDLREQLRLKGIGSLADVQAAYKEPNGEISVIPRSQEPRILEVAVAPGVQTIRIRIE
ncbi:MAG: DUF421 domain-containing protein [Pirellulaceae bacterium]|nr:DUF421 domain-containing protein [Pirellulaceae bacterium]